MRSLRTKRLSGAVGLGLWLGLLLANGCSAANKGGGTVTRDGSSGSTNLNTNAPTGGGDGGSCQHQQLNFQPKTPTVFVLVDRSGSMFSGATPPWEPLKTGALQVIQELQNDVAFGWGAFTGTKSTTPIQCPVFVSIDPTIKNYAAIAAQYQNLGALPNGEKAETPVGEALPLVQASLAKSTVDGEKYILFVTDGEPDFCDDGDSDCPLDDVIYNLQSLKSQGISTIIFGLQNSSVAPTTLQAFANAGAGAPVALPFKGDAQSVYYACSSVPGWTTDAQAAGKTGMDILGTYGATGGATPYYQPDPADQNALTTQLRSVLAGVKSCTFDLSDFTIDLTQLNLASVSVQGQVVPLDMTNGWRMNTSSQLELAGDACTNWKQPQNTTIDFNFPCEIVVPVK
jgi:von Willebrand factor type A domain